MDDLIQAHDLMASGDFAHALRLLAVLSGMDASNPRMAAIVTTARKLYAACLYAQRDPSRAHDVLALMLRADPDARLDQTQFDTEFVRFFERILREMLPELDQIRVQRAVSRDQLETGRLAREALMRRLLTTDSIESVPRVLTAIPFGVAQFANGQTGLGVFFLTTEVLLTAASVTTFALYQSMYTGGQFYDFSQAQLAQGLAIGNWASASVLAVTVIAGFIQAQVVYQPSRRRPTVPRPMPQELEGARLMAGPSPDGTGLGATLRLTF